jgi:hypothetical protein
MFVRGLAAALICLGVIVIVGFLSIRLWTGFATA